MLLGNILKIFTVNIPDKNAEKPKFIKIKCALLNSGMAAPFGAARYQDARQVFPAIRKYTGSAANISRCGCVRIDDADTRLAVRSGYCIGQT